ncbi:MAG: RnfABCDGE type electron transport complex subunit D [Oscillospiraceae bacterium]|nr:RnfABCDGE type electron transport complex subunit D [Oscillospiraceae bacterium]
MSNLSVSISPHIRNKTTTKSIMFDVVIALIPAYAASILVFGARAALITTVCMVSCVLWEFIYQKAMKMTVTINDGSALITGIILAFNLPVGIEIWQAVFGSMVAIILVKQLFGGLGKNFANPAVTARIVMFLAFSVSMTTWKPVDSITGATPLALMASGDVYELPSYIKMFLGLHGGSLGETSALALMIGGLYLIIKKVISWHTPVVFIATVFAFSAVLGQNPLYHILSGGLFLGAIFMATDYVTTPQTDAGRVVFGVGAGLLTVIFRVYGSYPEGVSFAILLMNILTPYINRATQKKPLGGIKA